jgi:hypothetical protein
VSPFAVGRGPGGPFALGPGSRGSRSPSRWGRWIPLPLVGAPEGTFPIGSGVRGSFRRGSWARWVRLAVRGARRRPSPWSGPGGSVTVARGPWIPFPGSGFRQVPRFGSSSRGSLSPSSGAFGSSCHGSWARWVRLAVQGARRRPSPWSGPGGSVTTTRGSDGALRCRSGARGPSRGSGRPKASFPVVGARWVRRRRSGFPWNPCPSARLGFPCPGGRGFPGRGGIPLLPGGRFGASAYRRPRPLKERFCWL